MMIDSLGSKHVSAVLTGLILPVFVIPIFVICAFAAQSHANENPSGTSRYSFTPAKNGYLRMDHKTGVIAFCMDKDNEWRCQAAKDDHLALQKQIERLRQENKELREKLRKADILRPKKPSTLPLPGPSAQNGQGSDKPHYAPSSPPSAEDIDKTMDMVEHMMRRFKDMMEKLKQKPEENKGTPL